MKPIGKWYCFLCDAGTRYDTTIGNVLQWYVLYCNNFFFLDETHLIVWTDHQALSCILDIKESTKRLNFWRLRLEGFDAEIVSRLGRYHRAANAVFRLSKEKDGSLCDKKYVDDDIPSYRIVRHQFAVCLAVNGDHFTALTMPTPKELFNCQQADTYCQRILKLICGSNSRLKMDLNELICWNVPL